MRKSKDLQFCLEILRSLQNRDGPEPEQRSALENARVKLVRLRRKSNPTRKEIFETVRKVAEAIIDALRRR